jgi:hypothetical protein
MLIPRAKFVRQFKRASNKDETRFLLTVAVSYTEPMKAFVTPQNAE